MPLAGDAAVEHDLRAGGLDRGHHAGDGLRVGVGEARRIFLDLLGVLLLGGSFFLLHQRDDHLVVGAEQSHLRQNLGFGSFADRQHRDHRGDPEENAERGERGPQLVVLDRLDRGAQAEEQVPDDLPAQSLEPVAIQPHG